MLLTDLNNKFPSGEVPTRLYHKKELIDVKKKEPNHFIAVVDKKCEDCKFYCFDFFLVKNKLVILKIKKLEVSLDIKIPILFEHVMSQRRIKREALANGKIIIGKIW